MELDLQSGPQEFQVGDVVLVQGTVIKVELVRQLESAVDYKRVYTVFVSREEDFVDARKGVAIFSPKVASMRKLPRRRVSDHIERSEIDHSERKDAL